MKKILLFLFLALTVLSCKKSENVGHSKMAKSIDSLMTYSYDQGLFNGTVLVSKNNEVIYRNSFGYADFDKNELLVPESSFYLASVSKQFTTMALMILKERGALSYDDKLSDYFPDFPNYAATVTLRHMMTHTSGIPDHYQLDAYKVGLTNDDVYELLVSQEDLDFEPGSQYSYSNGAYVLLSMIVEEVSGESFHDFMKTNIFTPLKMTNTLVYDKSELTVNKRAIGYNGSGGLDDYEIFTTGAGGLYSNIDDLFKWDQALNTDQLVSQESLNEAMQPYILSTGDTSNYGFGWRIAPENNWVGHSGGMAGFVTYLRRYLDAGDAFMILTNNGDALALSSINLGLENILANEDFELPKVPMSKEISKLLQDKDAAKAIEQAKEVYAQKPDYFEYDEAGINYLGYTFLQDEDIATALVLFKFNIENRPNSANSYDSYAEALLANKDTTASIENYIVSVRMNPNNLNGLNILDTLGVDIKEVLPVIELSQDQLAAFVGKYDLDTDFILNITSEDNRLYIQPTGQSKSELFAASESRFYSKEVDAQITFNRSDAGNVVGLTLHQDGDAEAIKTE